MAYEYKTISGDSHIDLRWLPGDLFEKNAPAKWRDKVPHVEETAEGLKWFAEGQDMATPYTDLSIAPLGAVSFRTPPPGASKHMARMHEMGFFDGRAHPTTPEVRLEDQVIDGIDAEVIYGPLGIDTRLKSRELLRVVYEIYNTWAADFRNTNPHRFAPLACIASDDPELAAKELRRSAKLGLKGADFGVTSVATPIWHSDWDVLWAAAEECQLPVSFHTRGISIRPPLNVQMDQEFKTVTNAVKFSVFQLAGAEVVASLVFSGALERFPGFHFVLGECGAVWIPYVLSRMDFEYDDQFSHLNFPLQPSEYWRRQGHTTFQREPLIADVLHLIGEDNVMWGSDYPHGDGVWPDSHMWMEKDMGRLSPEVRRKLTRDNAGKLYGFLNGS